MRTLSTLLILSLYCSLAMAQLAHPSADERIRDLQRLIDSSGGHWTAGHSTVSGLSDAERRAMLMSEPPKEYLDWVARQPKLQAEPGRTFPAVFDWRDSGAVTSVKNQAGCSSCWAFAAVGAFEAAIKRHDGMTYDLSEQQAISCNVYGSSCAGGYSEAALELFKRVGAYSESCMPYQGSNNVACNTSCVPVVRLKNWQYVANDVNSIKQALLTGPVSVSFIVYSDFWNYVSGCYSHVSHYIDGRHAVVIVGWNDNACGSGQGAWICKNSWGASWADLEGYFLIKWNDSGIGSEAMLPLHPLDPVDLSLVDHQIDDSSGDNDQIAEAGEQFALLLTLRNRGLVTATNVTAKIRTATTGVTILDSSVSFPAIGVNQTQSSTAPHFVIRLGATLATLSVVDLTLVLTCDQGNIASSLRCYVGHPDTVFVDRMEECNDNWTSGGLHNDWECGTPRQVAVTDAPYPHGGFMARGNYLVGNYGASSDNYLESRVIDCSGFVRTRLCFWRWLACEKGKSDHARVLVNGNTVWENDSTYEQIDREWTYQDLDISAFADSNASVQIRFVLQSDKYLQFGGWTIDDLSVVGTPRFKRGDADGDGTLDVADAAYLVNYIFTGGLAPSPLAAGDADCDGTVDVADAVRLVNYIFGGGQVPGCN